MKCCLLLIVAGLVIPSSFPSCTMIFIILNNPKAGDTAFCDSEHTLSPLAERQGKRISWKVGVSAAFKQSLLNKALFSHCSTVIAGVQ